MTLCLSPCGRSVHTRLQHGLVDDARVVVEAPSQAEVEHDGRQRAHGLEEPEQRPQLGQRGGAARVERERVGGSLERGQQLKGAAPAHDGRGNPDR